jgi:hypothetical protein
LTLLLSILIIFCALLIGIVIHLLSLFDKLDLSTQRLYGQRLKKGAEPHLPITLISYADGDSVFRKNQNMLVFSALNKGFDSFKNYNKSLLGEAFLEKHGEHFQHKKGAGYWIWKPWICLKALEEAPENAIIVYADTGFVFKKPLTKIIELIEHKPIILFEWDPKIDGYIGRITKRDVLNHYNMDTEETRNGPHASGGFLIFKNTPQVRAFFNEWYLMISQIDLVSDEVKDPQNQHPEFSHHQQDESLLCLLALKNPDLCQYFQMNDLIGPYVTWHHRHARKEHRSLLLRHLSISKISDRWFLNNHIWSKIRGKRLRQNDSRSL